MQWLAWLWPDCDAVSTCKELLRRHSFVSTFQKSRKISLVFLILSNVWQTFDMSPDSYDILKIISSSDTHQKTIFQSRYVLESLLWKIPGPTMRTRLAQTNQYVCRWLSLFTFTIKAIFKTYPNNLLGINLKHTTYCYQNAYF